MIYHCPTCNWEGTEEDMPKTPDKWEHDSCHICAEMKASGLAKAHQHIECPICYGILDVSKFILV